MSRKPFPFVNTTVSGNTSTLWFAHTVWVANGRLTAITGMTANDPTGGSGAQSMAAPGSGKTALTS